MSVATDTEVEREARLYYILEMVKEGYTLKKSCRACGVSYRAFRNWTESDPEVLAAYESAKADLHEQVGEVAKLCALKAETDPRYQTSLLFYLRCRAGWNDGTQVPQGVMPSITFNKTPATEEKEPS